MANREKLYRDLVIGTQANGGTGQDLSGMMLQHGFDPTMASKAMEDYDKASNIQTITPESAAKKSNILRQASELRGFAQDKEALSNSTFTAGLGLGKTFGLSKFGEGKAKKQSLIGSIENVLSGETLEAMIDLKAEAGGVGSFSDSDMKLLEASASKIRNWTRTDDDGNVIGYEVGEEEMKNELNRIADTLSKTDQEGQTSQAKELDEAYKYATENPDDPDSAVFLENLNAGKYDLKTGEKIKTFDELNDLEKQKVAQGIEVAGYTPEVEEKKGFGEVEETERERKGREEQERSTIDGGIGGAAQKAGRFLFPAVEETVQDLMQGTIDKQTEKNLGESRDQIMRWRDKALEAEKAGDTKKAESFRRAIKRKIESNNELAGEIGGELAEKSEREVKAQGFQAAVELGSLVPTSALATKGSEVLGAKVGGQIAKEVVKAKTKEALGKKLLSKYGESVAIGGADAVAEVMKDENATTQDVTEAFLKTVAVNVAVNKFAGKILKGKGGKAEDVIGNVEKEIGEKLTPTQKSSITGFLKEKAGKVNEVVGGKNTNEEAIKQVIQGKTKDFKPAQRALSSIDTKGIKSNEDLSKKLGDSIKEISGKVDETLSKDTKIRKLSDLTTTSKTKAGTEVKTNFVQKGLQDMKAGYQKMGDDLKSAEIDDLLVKAKKEGLTAKEINDVSREYGQEFGSKAFGKTGEPLTSVNAQAFENTRKGLKNVSRDSIGGKEAKELDSLLGDMINTRKLIDKNSEAVNRAKSKINKMGLGKKILSGGVNIADKLSLGAFKSAREIIAHGNVGKGTLSPIDLEESLAKNLKIINKIEKATSEVEVKKLVNQLDVLTKKTKK